VAINDPDPALLAAHVALTVSAHGIGGEWFQTYLQRGVARSGITAGEAGYFFEEFTDIARWQKLGGVASLTAVTTLTGGVGEVAAGVGDNVAYANGDAVLGTPTICKGDNRLYVAVRMRLSVAPPADGVALVGLAPGLVGDQVFVGYLGPLDAVHFVGATNNAGISSAPSTVAVDAAWHDMEIWYAGDAANYYLSIDAETPVLLVSAPQPTDYLGAYLAINGGAGAGVTAQFDKYLCVFPQAA
jgi:hypothetical protein